MEVLNEDDDAWPFLEPVNEEDAPQYYEFVKHPMDFKTIDEKIEKKIYDNKHEFESDILLVFNNCETYNGTFSSYTKLANVVKKVFDKLFKREFPPDIEIDDDDFFEVDQPIVKPKKQKLVQEIIQNSPKPVKPVKLTTIAPASELRKRLISPDELARAQMLKAQARMKQLHQSAAMLHTSPRAALAAAANILPAQFGLPPDVVAKLTPAQMQALILGYARSPTAPPLSVIRPAGQQFTLSQKIGNITNAISSPPVAITTLNPLQQLANTALAPTSNVSTPNPRFSSPNFIVRTVTKTMSPGQVLTQVPIRMPTKFIPRGRGQSGARGSGQNGSRGRGQHGSNRGRPKKNTASVLESLPSSGYISAISAAGVPVTMKWEDLKKQLMSQMDDKKPNDSSLVMPVLRPVTGSPVATLKGLTSMSATTTTQSNSNTFSFSNIMKTKELMASVSAVNVKKTISSVSPTGINILTSQSKVQSWLNSNLNQVIPQRSNTAALSNTATNTSLLGSAASIRFAGTSFSANQSILTTNKPTIIQRPVSNIMPVAASVQTCVRDGTTIVASPQLDRVRLSSPIRSSVPNHSNQSLIDLQKAALQAAAINQISTKLQTHFNENKPSAGTSVTSVPIIGHNVIASPINSSVITSPIRSAVNLNGLMTPSPSHGLSLLNKINYHPGVEKINSSLVLPPASKINQGLGGQISPIIHRSQQIVSNQLPLQLSQMIMSNVPSISQPISQTFLPTQNGQSVPQTILPTHHTQDVSQTFQQSPPVSRTFISTQLAPLQAMSSSTQPVISSVPIIPGQILASQANIRPKNNPAQQAIRYIQIPTNSTTNPAVSSNPIIIQQRVNSQGQTIQYVIPGQNSMFANNLVNLSQLGNLPNHLMNNGNTTPKVQFLVSNLNNSSSTNNQVRLSNPSLPSIGNQVIISGPRLPSVSNQVILTGPPSQNIVNQVISGPRASSMSNIRPHGIEQSVVYPNKVNNIASTPIPALQRMSPVKTSIRLSNPQDNIEIASTELSINSPTIKSPITLKQYAQLPQKSNSAHYNGLAINGNAHTSSANYTLPEQKVSLQQTQKVSLPQTPLTVTPAQLEKLKEEGRIMMTSTGQLIMVQTPFKVNSLK